ncbi:UNVERIFIED_ORG: hypothetical protein J2W85_002158 [Ensifer adhaerens]|nr:hypothetical protein [Ensifer adhaerens]
MVELAATIFSDGPSSNPDQPKKPLIRDWGTWLEQVILAFTSGAGNILKTSRTALFADLSHAADTTAWVMGDPTVAYNGIYVKSGASGSGSWARVSDLPFSFIIANDAGAGTANAIQATTSTPVSASALIWLEVAETNTATPVTVAFNGGSTFRIKTASGTDVAIGGLPAGMIILGIISGPTFRLISEQSGTAFLAQLQEMLDEATQLATPADGTVSHPKLSSDLATSLPLAVNLFGIGDTYWDSRFDKAIDAASGYSNGADVYVPRGAYDITQREIPQNVRLILDGGAVIRARAATPSLFRITGGLSGVTGGRAVNPDGYATSYVLIDKPVNNLPVDVAGAYIAQFSEAIRHVTGDHIRVSSNTGIANGLFLNVVDDGRNSEVVGNYVLGGNGFRFDKNGQGAEGVSIIRNKVLPSTGGQYCLQLKCGLEFAIESNVFDQVIIGQAVHIDGQVNDVLAIKFEKNWFGRAAGAATANYGIYGVGQIRGLSSSKNTYAGWRSAGISLNGLSAGTLLDFVSEHDRFHQGDPCVKDIELTYAEGCSIVGADFSGGSSIVENVGVDGAVDGCNFAKSSAPSTISGGLRYGRQRKGLVLKNKGAGSLPADGSGVTISHGLGFTPSLADFSVITGGSATNDPSPIRITNIDSSQFIVGPRAACGFRQSPDRVSGNLRTPFSVIPGQ